MKIDRRILCGALLLAALLAGCGTNAPPTPPPTSATSPSVMTSPSVPAPGTAYPAPEVYPALNSPTETAYPAPTSVP